MASGHVKRQSPKFSPRKMNCRSVKNTVSGFTTFTLTATIRVAYGAAQKLRITSRKRNTKLGWEILLDVGKLGDQEDESWVFLGANLLYPNVSGRLSLFL